MLFLAKSNSSNSLSHSYLTHLRNRQQQELDVLGYLWFNTLQKSPIGLCDVILALIGLQLAAAAMHPTPS